MAKPLNDKKDLKKSRLLDDGIIKPKLIFWLILITIVTTILILKVTSVVFSLQFFEFPIMGDFATAAGSVTALVVGLIGSYLIYVTVEKQIVYNKMQINLTKKQIALAKQIDEKFEREKERTRQIEDRQVILEMMNSLKDDVKEFSHQGKTGPPAIYESVILQLKRDFDRSSFYTNTILKNIIEETFICRLLDNSYLSNLEANERNKVIGWLSSDSFSPSDNFIEEIKHFVSTSQKWPKAKQILNIQDVKNGSIKKLKVLMSVARQTGELSDDDHEYLRLPNSGKLADDLVFQSAINKIGYQNFEFWRNSYLSDESTFEEVHEFNDSSRSYTPYFSENFCLPHCDKDIRVAAQNFLSRRWRYHFLGDNMSGSTLELSGYQVSQIENFLFQVRSIIQFLDRSRFSTATRRHLEEKLEVLLNVNFSSDCIFFNEIRLAGMNGFSNYLGLIDLSALSYYRMKPLRHWILEKVYDAEDQNRQGLLDSYEWLENIVLETEFIFQETLIGELPEAVRNLLFNSIIYFMILYEQKKITPIPLYEKIGLLCLELDYHKKFEDPIYRLMVSDPSDLSASNRLVYLSRLENCHGTPFTFLNIKLFLESIKNLEEIYDKSIGEISEIPPLKLKFGTTPKEMVEKLGLSYYPERESGAAT